MDGPLGNEVSCEDGVKLDAAAGLEPFRADLEAMDEDDLDDALGGCMRGSHWCLDRPRHDQA